MDGSLEMGALGAGLPQTLCALPTMLAKHWDVLQDEATRAESKSGLPMFGNSFAD
jgi:hypothetical protein